VKDLVGPDNVEFQRIAQLKAEKSREFEQRQVIFYTPGQKPKGAPDYDIVKCVQVTSPTREELLEVIEVLAEAVEYLVARCEDRHPDGFIRSKKTYGKQKEALARAEALLAGDEK
jgi:hypothetical protein